MKPKHVYTKEFHFKYTLKEFSSKYNITNDEQTSILEMNREVIEILDQMVREGHIGASNKESYIPAGYRIHKFLQILRDRDIFYKLEKYQDARYKELWNKIWSWASW